MKQTLSSIGQIESTTLEDGVLAIEGWACSPSSELQSFTVRFGAYSFEGFDHELFIESPGLQAFFPPIPSIEHARFRLRIPLGPSEIEALEGALVELVPRFANGEGRRLLTIAVPAVSPPSQQELALVSPNLPVAFEFLDYFTSVAGLRPDQDVLDVGCGAGRMAYPLAHYLGAAGHYEGFDIVPEYIEIAQRRYEALTNFRFQHVDIHNQFFSPGGTLSPTEFSFPYADESFDFVFLASIFTHMRSAEVRHYLDEIQRVLRPGARCLLTAFILNDESVALMEAGKGRIHLRHRTDEWCSINAECPEKALGYDEEALLAWIAERGLRLEQDLRGSWCGRLPFVSYQDLLLVSKPVASSH